MELDKFILLSIIILITMCMGMILSNYPTKQVVEREQDISYLIKTSQFKIFYDGLNEIDKIKINEIIDEIDPKYFSLVKNMTFTNNISKYCNNCIGININNGDRIYINYIDNKEILFDVVCHELLHTYFRDIPLELEEEFVEDAEAKDLCFGRRSWERVKDG